MALQQQHSLPDTDQQAVGHSFAAAMQSAAGAGHVRVACGSSRKPSACSESAASLTDAWLFAGKLMLVADFGRFVLKSDTGLAATLPVEEASVYECLTLKGRDISALHGANEQTLVTLLAYQRQ